MVEGMNNSNSNTIKTDPNWGAFTEGDNDISPLVWSLPFVRRLTVISFVVTVVSLVVVTGGSCVGLLLIEMEEKWEC